MSLTTVFVLVVVVASIGFDYFIIYKKGKKESISAYVIRWSHAYPMIPFLVGFLCGHLFWSMNTADWIIQ